MNIEQLLRNKENGLSTVLVFLDLKKSFDSVNHSILIKKLNHSGIREQALQLLSSYLADRKQYVQIDDSQSEKLTVSCGVPQGSLLGFLLFLLYVNDLPKNINSRTKLFAHDTVLYTADKCMIKLQIVINRELNYLNNWLIANKLSINTVKTQFMVVSQTAKNSDSIRLYINNEELKRIKIYEYLGVWKDGGLNWKAYIAKLSSTLSLIVGVLFKIRNFVSMHCLKILY